MACFSSKSTLTARCRSERMATAGGLRGEGQRRWRRDRPSGPLSYSHVATQIADPRLANHHGHDESVVYHHTWPDEISEPAASSPRLSRYEKDQNSMVQMGPGPSPTANTIQTRGSGDAFWPARLETRTLSAWEECARPFRNAPSVFSARHTSEGMHVRNPPWVDICPCRCGLSVLSLELQPLNASSLVPVSAVRLTACAEHSRNVWDPHSLAPEPTCPRPVVTTSLAVLNRPAMKQCLFLPPSFSRYHYEGRTVQTVGSSSTEPEPPSLLSSGPIALLHFTIQTVCAPAVVSQKSRSITPGGGTSQGLPPEF